MKWVVKEGCAEGIVKPRSKGQKEPGGKNIRKRKCCGKEVAL